MRIKYIFPAMLLGLSACEYMEGQGAQSPSADKKGCNAIMPAIATIHEINLCNAGKLGTAESLYEVGSDYLYAREGAKRDCDKARFFYTQAAARGEIFARMKLAELYGGGVFTSAQPVKQCVTADFPQAHAYLRAAHEQLAEIAKTKKPDSLGVIPDLAPGLKALEAKLKSPEAKKESETLYLEITKQPK